MAEKERAKVRISKSLSDGEKAAIASRKQEVKKGLAKLGIQCDMDQIPNITVLGSGGALRAMIALYGTLAELKKYQFLDCIMYLAGVSGSTWCISALYRTEDWVQKIELLEKHQRENLVKSKWDLKMAKTAVMEASKDELYSLTDFWSYFIVHKLLKEFDESELSAHRRCCETGKNPYPIYAAVDKETCEEQNTGTWFEFTPHEAGVPGLGAYVDIKHFGSIFEKGQLYEKKKGKNICYLQGLWGSALGSEKELIQMMSGALMDFPKDDSPRPDSSTESAFYSQDDQDIGILGWAYLAVLELLLCSSDEKIDEKLFDNLESILKVSGDHFHTMVKKTLSCLWGWTWGSTNNFLYQCSDVKLPELTDKQVVSLIDAGLAINTAYPLVLRPERQAKLILSFDFSAGDPFETIKKAAEYCKEHGLPFPKIDEIELQDTDDPSDCYIFKGENAPTVMHFPLFNKFNCPGKVAEYRDQFGTFKMSYSEEEIEKLLTAAKKNVANAHQKILEEIKHVACPLSRKA